MSVFSPMDVLTPIDRRKQLLSKLMDQYTQSQQASAQTPMPGAVHAMNTPFGGNPWRGAMEGQAGPHTSVTDPYAYQLPPGIAQALGAGGLGQQGHGVSAGEASPGVGAPVLPPHLTMTPGQAPSQPGSPGQAGRGYGAGVAPVGQAQPIALGNGVFYDPLQDAIVNRGGGVGATQGGAAAALGGGGGRVQYV